MKTNKQTNPNQKNDFFLTNPEIDIYMKNFEFENENNNNKEDFYKIKGKS